MADVRRMLPIFASPSPSPEQSMTISGATNVCNWFLHNFKGNGRCSSSCQRAHWEDKSLRKQPNNPAASCWCASPFNCFLWAELQECRYWLLLPNGNAGDRLKRRGKKIISQLVCPEQEKVPDTNKLINAESLWGQCFPSPPLFFWFFLTVWDLSTALASL